MRKSMNNNRLYLINLDVIYAVKSLIKHTVDMNRTVANSLKAAPG